MGRRAPGGLGARGRRFWRGVTAGFELSEAELELLVEACRLLDTLEVLEAAVAVDGVTTVGSRGQVRVHPAVGALQSGRATLGRLLAQLDLPDEEGASVPSPATLRARAAAEARWRQRDDLEAARRRRSGGA